MGSKHVGLVYRDCNIYLKIIIKLHFLVEYCVAMHGTNNITFLESLAAGITSTDRQTDITHTKHFFSLV
jgi:hypothetical protein